MSLLSAAFHRVVPSHRTLAPVNYLGAFAFPHEIFSWVLDEMLVGCVTMFPSHADVPALSRALVPPLRASTPPPTPAKWVENPPEKACDCPQSHRWDHSPAALFRSREGLGESNTRLLFFGERSWFSRAFSLKRRRGREENKP